MTDLDAIFAQHRQTRRGRQTGKHYSNIDIFEMKQAVLRLIGDVIGPDESLSAEPNQDQDGNVATDTAPNLYLVRRATRNVLRMQQRQRLEQLVKGVEDA